MWLKIISNFDETYCLFADTCYKLDTVCLNVKDDVNPKLAHFATNAWKYVNKPVVNDFCAQAGQRRWLHEVRNAIPSKEELQRLQEDMAAFYGFCNFFLRPFQLFLVLAPSFLVSMEPGTFCLCSKLKKQKLRNKQLKN